MSELTYPHALLFTYYSSSDRDRQYSPTLHKESLNSLVPLDKYEVKGRKLKKSWHNTNGLLLLCSLEEEEKPPGYNRFDALTQQLLTARELEEKAGENIGEKIGQTLILTGYLPAFVTFNQENCQKVAQSAYENLGNRKAQPWYSPLITEKFGARGFSFGETPIKFARKKREEIEHILILIYRDRTALEAIGNYCQYWLELFCSRHHIISAYRNTRKIKEDIKAYYSPARVFRDRPDYPKDLIHFNLEHLEKAISESQLLSAQYTEGISNLETRKAAIATNLHNYQQQLQKFSPTDELSQLVTQYYLPQIQQDIATLTPGLRLQETWIDTLRGMVEIQRAKSDREIEALIGAAGVGVGVASAASSTASALIKDFQFNWTPSQNLTVVLSGSLLLGFFLGWLTFILLKKRRSR